MSSSKILRYISIICALSFFLTACGSEERGWKNQIVPEGNFSVDMPLPMQKAEKTEITVFGKQVRHFVRWKPSSFAIDKFKLFEVS